MGKRRKIHLEKTTRANRKRENAIIAMLARNINNEPEIEWKRMPKLLIWKLNCSHAHPRSEKRRERELQKRKENEKDAEWNCQRKLHKMRLVFTIFFHSHFFSSSLSQLSRIDENNVIETIFRWKFSACIGACSANKLKTIRLLTISSFVSPPKLLYQSRWRSWDV